VFLILEWASSADREERTKLNQEARKKNISRPAPEHPVTAFSILRRILFY
tara:strand:- start:69 stop:218 length:150 start_codon:yes stop_codon:yes gene_type:complete